MVLHRQRRRFHLHLLSTTYETLAAAIITITLAVYFISNNLQRESTMGAAAGALILKMVIAAFSGMGKL